MADKHVFIFENDIYEIPEYMRDGLELYVQMGVVPGDFLSAVIANDLKKAVMYADVNNMRNLPAYANFFYNYAPVDCWGSVQNLNDWHNKGGLIGIRSRREQAA